MDLLDLANHLFNFVAPALFVALSLALISCIAPRRTIAGGGVLHRFWRSFWINAAVGVVVLAAGLIVFGRDAKLLTYAALIVACGSSQWLLSLGRGARDRSQTSGAR